MHPRTATGNITRDDPAFDTWESNIHAFVALADPVGSGQHSGALVGRTVAVKDIIDVAGLPTRNGSRACADVPQAGNDADVVARLRSAGARIVGKTVTTEFAFTDPTPCRNPYALDRSPGGSSSGSGAAVGAGLVDLALGTQTAGSLIRPAAYCGVVGFKPGLGVLPMDGITPLSPSYDMVGVIARSVQLAAQAFSAMQGAHQERAVPFGRAGMLMFDAQDPIDPQRRAALDDACGHVAARTGPLQALQSGLDISGIIADHRTVMCAEAAALHGDLLGDATRGLLMPKFRAALHAGRTTDARTVEAARRRMSTARAAFWERHADIDLFVTLPVPQGPPLLGGSTGYQHWLTVWTVLGGPLLCLPWGLDTEGLPVSVMLAAPPGREAALLEFGEQIAADGPVTPPPTIPDR